MNRTSWDGKVFFQNMTAPSSGKERIKLFILLRSGLWGKIFIFIINDGPNNSIVIDFDNPSCLLKIRPMTSIYSDMILSPFQGSGEKHFFSIFKSFG